MRFDFILLSRDARATSPFSQVRFDIFARYQWSAETERLKWSSWPRHERTREKEIFPAANDLGQVRSLSNGASLSSARIVTLRA